MDIIASEIDRLHARIAKLHELRDSPHATPELFEALQRTLGTHGLDWLFVPSPALSARPVEWVLAGRTQALLDYLDAIDNGVYV